MDHVMDQKEIVVLNQMKNKLVNEIKDLQHKLNLIEQLLAGNTVVSEEPTEAPIKPTPRKSIIKKRQRTASSNSIISRVKTVITDNPDIEFSTSELAAELKEHWKKDYGKKDNLMSVISAIMTAKENQSAEWFTRTKRNGKWYFRADHPESIKKSA